MTKKEFLSGCIITIVSLVTMGLAVCSCSDDKKTYTVGVSQCSDDEWRDKLNSEIRMMDYINDSINVVIKKSNNDSRTQEKQIDSLINMGIDLLVVSPNQTDEITPAVEKAYNRGIPVILYDRTIKSDKYTTFIGSNNYKIGRDLGMYVADKLCGKGTVAEIRGLEGSSPSEERHRGFTDAIREYPGIRTVDTEYGEWNQESGRKAMERILGQGETPDYVFAHNDRMAYGAYLAAKRRKLEKRIKFVGVDGLPGDLRGIDLVRRGILDASYLNPTSGDEVIKLATKILNGEKVEKTNNLAISIITKDNAELTLMAAQNAKRQRDILEELHHQVDRYEVDYETQTIFTVLLSILLIVVLSFSLFIYRSYLTKKKFTEELTRKNGELKRLNGELLELTQSKLTCFTNVSHELRTPLTLVIDPLQRVLADTALSAQAAKMLKIAERNALVLKKIVDDIMDLRKTQDNKMKLNLSRFDLTERLRVWADDFRPSAETRRITLEVDTAKCSDGTVVADRIKMCRIVFNLISNALKYTPAGGTVTISLSDAPGGMVAITVDDTGRGISENDQKKVFERFFQAQNSTGGTGIGLAVVMAYAKLHNGEATVASDLGKGSSFRVTIPRKQKNVPPANDNGGITTDEKEETAEMHVMPPTEAESDKPLTHGNDDADKEKPRLLVIDDNRDIRDYIRETFKSNFEIIEAENGKEGMEAALKYVPDIVVCDVMMPVMNGIEFCTLLKSNTAVCHIPVILLTAKSLDEHKIEGYGHGADSYITKPFSSKVLSAKIYSLLRNRTILSNLFGGKHGNSTASNAEAATGKDAAADNDAGNRLNDIDRDFIHRLQSIISENMADSDFGVESIGGKIGLSRVQLYRKVKAITGTSVVDLLRRARLQQADKLLKETDKSISEIAYEVGFSSPSYFTKCYKDEYGSLPGDTRNR